jgi:hypothetical protein
MTSRRRQTVNPSNEHLVREQVAGRLAAAEAHHARRRLRDERPEPQRSDGRQRHTLPALALPLHPNKKGTPA